MRQPLASGILVCLLMSAASTALAADTERSQALIAVEHQWVQAAKAGDKATLARILASDFIDVSWRGAIRSRADVLARPAAPASSSQKLKNLEVRLYGDTAIVNGLNLVTMKNQHWKIRFTDVFIRQDGRWRAVSAQETQVRPATDRNE
ncbi:MAG: nuclear transport factor 2 family protein [Gammaproteobacteria bacterium]